MGRGTVIETLRAAARPLTGDHDDHDLLLERAADARLVLLGEATHGTHEFYRERARITLRLIDELGFDVVAVEADWPDAERVDRYVRGLPGDADADAALASFRRFPTWMWRNADVRDLVEALRVRNERVADPDRRVGFHGLDLYSLRASTESVVRLLSQVDPEAARRARERYACFDHVDRDGQSYAYATAFGAGEPCDQAVMEQLVDVRRWIGEARGDGPALFSAEQNARVVANAERYYRAMVSHGPESWNLRDTHMVETLEALVDHARARGGAGRAVVWAHNSHLGDARATEMGEAGQVNVGSLVRERHGSDAVLVGFTTATGQVMAADEWDGPGRIHDIRPPHAGSYEALLHELGGPAFTLDLGAPAVADALGEPRLERAIGVIYRAATERRSHLFHAALPEQFDVLVHLDRTTPVRPLAPSRLVAEPPDLWPTGV